MPKEKAKVNDKLYEFNGEQYTEKEIGHFYNNHQISLREARRILNLGFADQFPFKPEEKTEPKITDTQPINKCSACNRGAHNKCTGYVGIDRDIAFCTCNVFRDHENASPLNLVVSRFNPEDKEESKDFTSVTKDGDAVNHPPHYNSDPSGVECIAIVRHRNFNIGNSIKYLWRAGLKDSDSDIQDLEKAIFYIQDEIKRLKRTRPNV